MGSFRADVVYALRSLRKNPVFALTAAVTLALGIGATTAIFSVVKAVLLQPLPYKDPKTLVRIVQDMRNRNVFDFPIAGPDFVDMQDRITAFDGVAGFNTFRPVLTMPGEAEPRQFKAGVATANLFRVLGAGIDEGRDFTDADGTPLPPPPDAPAPAPGPPPTQPAVPPPPPPPVACILSHEFWTRQFGGDKSVVGQMFDFGDGGRVEVVGVLAPGFEMLLPPSTNTEVVPDIWFVNRQNFAALSRNNVFLRAVARLKPGVPLTQARTQLDALGAELREQFPIKKTAGVYFFPRLMADDLVGEVEQGVWALMGAVIFVLLIACANVANLLLVRTAARERELAVRTALGGGRGRLLRQLLTESLTLAAIGAVLGILLARFGVRLLLALDPSDLPRLGHIAIDGTVLTGTLAATVLSAVAFGLAPAIRASRPNVIDVLRKTGRTGGLGTGRWLRNTVVITEVALSFVLLVGCGLMIRSFVELQRIDPGYEPENLLTLTVQNAQFPRDPSARQAFTKDLKARLEALPDVQSVTASLPLPLDGGNTLVRYGPLEAATDATKYQQAIAFTVLPGYFDTMKTRVLDGRAFTEADNVSGLKVVIIDTLIKARLFPGESAVGKTMLARIQTPEAEQLEIIGVVQHQRHTDLATEGREGLYIMDAYRGFGTTNRWAIRTKGDPLTLAPIARADILRLNPRLAVFDMQPMSYYVDKAQGRTRFALVLIGIFAGIALVLASVGLYGVLSTTVRQRTAEIGVRMAFGAAQKHIFTMMVGQGLALSAIGLAVGLLAAYLLTGALRTLLVGVRPTDPLTFCAIAAVFLTVGALAAAVPAMRAARLDPVVALRDE